MEFGKIEYRCNGRKEGKANRRALRLTLVGPGDKDTLDRFGVRALRQARIIRLTREASEQGCLLGYDDLSALLLTSFATLKRDVSHLSKSGHAVELRGRRHNGDVTRGHDNTPDVSGDMVAAMAGEQA